MTKKELKDYLPLYLGCEVLFGNGNLTGKLIDTDGINVNFYTNAKYNISIKKIKPILRPLSDVSDYEWNQIEESIDLPFDAQGIDVIRDNFLSDKQDERCGWELVNKSLIELRKISVDVDGLIEAGLAIDATTVNL